MRGTGDVEGAPGEGCAGGRAIATDAGIRETPRPALRAKPAAGRYGGQGDGGREPSVQESCPPGRYKDRGRWAKPTDHRDPKA